MKNKRISQLITLESVEIKDRNRISREHRDISLIEVEIKLVYGTTSYTLVFEPAIALNQGKWLLTYDFEVSLHFLRDMNFYHQIDYDEISAYLLEESNAAELWFEYIGDTGEFWGNVKKCRCRYCFWNTIKEQTT